MSNEPEWTLPHSHEPNPTPPPGNADITLHYQGGSTILKPDSLLSMRQQLVHNCTILSTGHGTSGPFTFGGVPLSALVENYLQQAWSTVEIISADGFRTRLAGEELRRSAERPVLLALTKDGQLMSREEGLVRLVVPYETGGALQQVKWVSEIRIIE